MGDTYVCDVCAFGNEVYETVESTKKGGILRVVRGPVAEWTKLNRNKRMYSEKLWDRVLSSPYVQEQLRHHTLYGEAGHPTDRYEVDFGRVSHSITEMWKVPASNQIYATIHILDTPLGRIINTLYEAGGIIGYSSRAGGNLIPKKGYTEVDENSYNFVTFDAVPYPSVEAARPPIVEGVELPVSKSELPDDVHEKLCKIINESSSESREAIKGLIYSLESYDMSREINLLDDNHASDNKNISENGTTMSLLKESSLQIDNLKSTNKSLNAEKLNLEKENKRLKDSLGSSLESITRLMNESSSFEKKMNDTESMFNDTINGLNSKIHELTLELGDKDLEIESLVNVQEAFKALQYENRGLKSEISMMSDNRDRVISLSEENESYKTSISEAYDEISNLIKESTELNARILELENTINSKDDVIRKLEEDRQILEGASVEKMNDSSAHISNLELENSDLKDEIKELNESVGILESKSKMYRDELVSVICSGYNLDAKSVMDKLPAGFSKSDIYRVCESISNSTRIDGISISSVIVDESLVESSNKEKSRKVGFIPFAADRRGRGK